MAENIYGTKGNDNLVGVYDSLSYIYGLGGNDVLTAADESTTILAGGKGSDTLIGAFDGASDFNTGFDRFVFNNDKAKVVDRVINFENGADELDFSRVSEYDNWREVKDDMVQKGENVVIRFDSTKIIIEDVNVSDFTADDFYF